MKFKIKQNSFGIPVGTIGINHPLSYSFYIDGNVFSPVLFIFKVDKNYQGVEFDINFVLQNKKIFEEI